MDINKVTKEQLRERKKQEYKKYQKYVCPFCKDRFRENSRLNDHINKQNCSCKECGMIYETAFQRSDHRWSCNVRLKNGMIENEKHPKDVKIAMKPLLWDRASVSSTPQNIKVATALPRISPQSLPSLSKFVLPSLSLDFWPPQIQQPLCPVENTKFCTKVQLNEPSEPSFDLENVEKPSSNKLDREIRTLLVYDKLEILKDF